MESVGLRQYVHKYDFGMQDYYWLLRYQEEIKNLTDSEWRTKNPAEAYKTERKVREGGTHWQENMRLNSSVTFSE